MKNPYWRIVDANYNRTKEALRVCEDFSRFFLNNRSLTSQFKTCRHRLTKLLLRFPTPLYRIVATRNVKGDVGRKGRRMQDRPRPGWRDIFMANLKRGQEAVRVIEELSKILAPRQAVEFERLRFRLYELEKQSLRKF